MREGCFADADTDTVASWSDAKEDAIVPLRADRHAAQLPLPIRHNRAGLQERRRALRRSVMRSSGLIATLFAAAAVIALPSGVSRAETADSIMESRKTVPRHKEVKKLGIHHSSCGAHSECQNRHWISCSNKGGRCICRPTPRRC
jgi:hypothetical protein